MLKKCIDIAMLFNCLFRETFHTAASCLHDEMCRLANSIGSCCCCRLYIAVKCEI